MARAIKKALQPLAAQPQVQSSHPTKVGQWTVKRVVANSAPLVEVPASSLMWLGPKDGSVPHADWLPRVWDGVQVQGCIAKVTPPATATEAAINAIEGDLYARGALAVRMMPAELDDKLQSKLQRVESGIDVVNRPLRQVAMERAGRVTNARDLKALCLLVGEAMDHVEQS